MFPKFLLRIYAYCRTVICTGIKVQALGAFCGGSHWRLFLGGLYRGPLLKGPYWKGPYSYILLQIRAPFEERLLWEAHTEGPFVGAV